jgi:hypothetical protein
MFVDDLCKKLLITRPTIYLYVGTDEKIREYGKRVVRTGALTINKNCVPQSSGCVVVQKKMYVYDQKI